MQIDLGRSIMCVAQGDEMACQKYISMWAVTKKGESQENVSTWNQDIEAKEREWYFYLNRI